MPCHFSSYVIGCHVMRVVILLWFEPKRSSRAERGRPLQTTRLARAPALSFWIKINIMASIKHCWTNKEEEESTTGPTGDGW